MTQNSFSVVGGSAGTVIKSKFMSIRGIVNSLDA